MKKQSKPRIKVIASSVRPVFDSVAEELGASQDAPEHTDEAEVEPEPAPVESEQQLHNDMVRLVLERIEVKEAASESAKTFRRKIEAIDAQVESIARKLDTMGLVETFERVSDCASCGMRHEWRSPTIDGEGETVIRACLPDGEDYVSPGNMLNCSECGALIYWGDILVVRRRPNGEIVDTRPVLSGEAQLALKGA